MRAFFVADFVPNWPDIQITGTGIEVMKSFVKLVYIY